MISRTYKNKEIKQWFLRQKCSKWSVCINAIVQVQKHVHFLTLVDWLLHMLPITRCFICGRHFLVYNILVFAIL